MARFLSFLKFLGWIAVAVSLAWFAANNTEPVELRFNPLSIIIDVPPWLILFAGIFIGLVAGTVATSWRRLKAFVDRRKLARDRTALDQEVAVLSEEAHKRAAEDAHAKLTGAAVTGIAPSKDLTR